MVPNFFPESFVFSTGLVWASICLCVSTWETRSPHMFQRTKVLRYPIYGYRGRKPAYSVSAHSTIQIIQSPRVRHGHGHGLIFPSFLSSLVVVVSTFTMLLARPARTLRTIPRNSLRLFASATSPTHSLLLVEHRSGEIEAGTLSALTAASRLGGKVTAIVVGGSGDVDPIVEKVKK